MKNGGGKERARDLSKIRPPEKLVNLEEPDIRASTQPLGPCTFSRS